MRTIKLYITALFNPKQRIFTLSLILFIVLLFLTLLLLRSSQNPWGENSLYVNVLEPTITVGTFLIAAILGVQNTKKAWENGLAKKMTVHIKYKDNYIYTCHKAYLAGESDIRQMAQQIGSQMHSGKLNMFPYMHITPAEISENENYHFKHYEVTIFLSSCDKNKYTIWWDNDPSTPENKSIEIEKQKSVISEAEAEIIFAEHQEKEYSDTSFSSNQIS